MKNTKLKMKPVNLNEINPQDILNLIKKAKTLTMKSYFKFECNDEDSPLYEAFEEALNKIVHSYRPKHDFPPKHLYSIYFDFNGNALLEINMYDDMTGLKVYTDMKKLTKFVTDFVTTESLKFDETGFIISKKPKLEGFNYDNTLYVIEEDFGDLVNGYYPKRLAGDNNETFNLFVRYLRDEVYERIEN